MTTIDVEPITMTRLQSYERELTHHATTMLRARFEAEDAVQETMMRAWGARDRFEGRSQLRSWLYRICTNVCLDMLASRQRRALLNLETPGSETPAVAPDAITMWARSDADPAEVAVARESVRLALVAVLHYLPPKQRAALMLREVLHWSASEIAGLLGTSVPAVNSALQRARATLRSLPVASRSVDSDVDEETRWRVGRYARALETSDVRALTALIAHEAA
jgi:RNA polymerase sigma-70 factor, ECF subfamily